MCLVWLLHTSQGEVCIKLGKPGPDVRFNFLCFRWFGYNGFHDCRTYRVCPVLENLPLPLKKREVGIGSEIIDRGGKRKIGVDGGRENWDRIEIDQIAQHRSVLGGRSSALHRVTQRLHRRSAVGTGVVAGGEEGPGTT